MNIRRSRGALTRALMQRARNNRSTKVLANRSNRSTSSTSSTKTNATSKTTDTTKVELYEKVEKAADNLQDYAALLIKLGKTEIASESTTTGTTTENTISQSVATTESTATSNTTNETDTAQSTVTSTKEKELQNDIVEAVEKLVTNFNTVYESLTELGGTVNTMYASRIKNLAYSNKTQLTEVGVTQNKNGTLAIDEKKLESVALDDLKAVFCMESGLIGDLQEHAKSMKESAAATASVLNKMYGSSTYNQYGTSSSYFNYAGSLYNYWG